MFWALWKAEQERQAFQKEIREEVREEVREEGRSEGRDSMVADLEAIVTDEEGGSVAEPVESNQPPYQRTRDVSS